MSEINITLTRSNMLINWALLNFKVGVEIGTDLGRFAEEICTTIPDVKLYCVDPYLPYVERDSNRSAGRMNQDYRVAKRRLKKYNCEILKMTSMEALKQFKDNSLDFVYIDGNHDYQFVLDDITGWTKKVKMGGAVAGHDYKQYKHKNEDGVRRAIKDYTDKTNRNFFVLTGDKSNGWIFFKL